MVSLNGDGLTLTYSRTGAGPAVILVQGVGMIGNGWAPHAEGLARRAFCDREGSLTTETQRYREEENFVVLFHFLAKA